MKFRVLKSDLLNKLTPAMGTVSNKNTITSIEGVLIETLDDGSIRLSTYDMNKGVRSILFPESVEREGKYIINAQRFYQTVRVLPEEEIEIEVNENLNCTITSGKASFSMFAMKGEEFPTLPELQTDKGFEIESSVLRKMISKVLHSVAEQDPRPMLKGAFFKINKDSFEIVSCDSYTLSICKSSCSIDYIGDAEGELSFIIPGHALSELCKIIGDNDEKIKFYLARKHAIIRNGEIVFFTRTIDSEYIDYNRIIPKENDILVTINRERFLSGLERANLIAEEKIQGSGKSYVKLIIDENYVNITSTSNNGKVSDEIECNHSGNPLEIGFNCRFLINSIKAAEGENIFITLKGATQAITIEPGEKDDKFSYYYMILPVRMNDK